MIGGKKFSGLDLLIKNVTSTFEGLSLGTKLILSYIVILALPLIFYGIYSFNSFKNTVEVDALKNCQLAMQKVKSDINRNIGTCKSVAQYIDSNKKFKEFVGTKKSYPVEELLEFKYDQINNIESLRNINVNINQLHLFFSNPELPEIWPVIYSDQRVTDNKRIADNKWFQRVKVLGGVDYWRLAHKEDVLKTMNATRDNVVSLYREIRNSDNQYVGVLEVNMLTRAFFGMPANQLDPNSTIISRGKTSHRVITIPDERLFLRDGLTSSEILSSLIPETRGEEGDFLMAVNDKLTLAVAYTYIEPIDSYIYQIVTINALTKKIDKMRNTIMLGSLVAILALSVVTFLITSIILKKLQIIVSSMRKVQNGEFEVEIPIRGRDEIGELAYHYRKMVQKINELISIVVKKQTAAKDAELRALQSQINAHFIYNVLEGIKMMAEIDGSLKISDAIASLGQMIRYNMKWSKPFVHLKEEIDYIKNYIAILNIRFEKEIWLQVDLRDESTRYEVPKMLLQPLIENAVYHGIIPKGKQGTVSVTTYFFNNNFIIEVVDDGMGICPERLGKLQQNIISENELDTLSEGELSQGNGIGLKNINERIKLFYGNQYGISIESKLAEYTKIKITLPGDGLGGKNVA